MSNNSFVLIHKDFDLNQFISSALKEDIGSGDHTSISTIPASAKGKSQLLIKDNGILAGVSLAEKIFKQYDKNLRIKILLRDGSKIKKGDIVFTVEGSARSILTTERLVLNCMQRMSGIATQTNKFVVLCKPYKTKLLDTRKTTPLLRGLEKWAVRIGGGHNHRYGLYDMILIKNNHIDFVARNPDKVGTGGIKSAIESANDYLKKKKLNLKIEIEVRNMKEIKEVNAIGKVDRILLDNFSPAEIRKAVKYISNKSDSYRIETEISGGVNEKNIRKYASCGADYISVGALTHSAKSLDMSLTAV